MDTSVSIDRPDKDKSRLPRILDDIDIRLLYAGYDDLAPGSWNHAWLPNDFWRLYQNDADGGYLTLRDETVELAAGSVYLVPSGLQLSSRNTGRLGHFVVHFDLRGVPPLALRDLFPGPALVDGGPDFRRLADETGRRVAGTTAHDMSVGCQVKAVIYLAIARHLEHLTDDLVEISWTRFQAMGPLMPALRIIDSQLGQALSNRELAFACAMSENHFIRRFRQTVGLTPASFIQQKRLAEAAQMLLYTDESIDAIALKTGFTDRFYMSRVFRRSMGHPPATYRRLPRI